jgi:hypothetical protein
MIVPFIGLLMLIAIVFYAWGHAEGRDEERKLHGWTFTRVFDPIERDYSFLDDFDDAHPGFAPTNVPMGVFADVRDEPTR